MKFRNHQRGARSSILDPAILVPAIGQSFVKLDPRILIRNPVMFVVEVVAVFTTVVFLRELASGGGNLGFTLQIIFWLWLTVLFANFAEAVAEGRGKAQAATLRKARTETQAKRLLQDTQSRADPKGLYELVAAPTLTPGDLILVEAGDLIASDGLDAAVGAISARHGLGLGAAQAGRLRLAATLGDRLGEVGEQHGEPQPDRDIEDEPCRGFAVSEERLGPQGRGEDAADIDDEHHRITPLHARIELAQRVHDRRADQAAVEHREVAGHVNDSRASGARRWARARVLERRSTPRRAEPCRSAE